MVRCPITQNYAEGRQLECSIEGFANAGHDDVSASAGDASAGLNKPHEESKSSNLVNVSSSSYWRDVRANLVRREQVSLVCF